ncbi:MAG: ABC transporter permease subunit [Anaerolineae bacterium]
MVRDLLRRILSGLLVLVAISLVSLFAQHLAGRTQFNAVAPLGEVLARTARDAVAFWQRWWRGDLGVYAAVIRYGSSAQPVCTLLGAWLLNSGVLLVLAMALGGLVGGLLGVLAAAVRRPGVSLAVVVVSIVGVSMPSFLLGMLLQLAEITFYKQTGIRLVPVGGYGWDSHLVLPVLVLAGRPIAQVARLTHMSVSAVLGQDYVRTAHAKGQTRRGVWMLHILPNVLPSVLTGMVTSLRFSLSSLPVVEVLFGWPGAGLALLVLLRNGQIWGATAVIVLMGGAFVLANILLEAVYRILDPRLRDHGGAGRVEATWSEWTLGVLTGVWSRLSARLRRRRDAGTDVALGSLRPLTESRPLDPDAAREQVLAHRKARRLAWLRALAGNPSLFLGLGIGAVLLLLILVGPSLALHDPAQLHPTFLVDGQLVTPPLAPSADYPLGTDAQGRDILSLLLVGARRTLAIASLAVVARLLIGGGLGFLAGWFAGSWLDRALLAVVAVLASFPALLLAMLVVYAVGIKQGLSAFVIALAVIGWGEVLQTVRAQVMAVKPMAYIEGAIASGAGEGHLLSAHVLPNVWPTMVSLAFLEMGGVLVVLGELGFLGVFIGGGFMAGGGDTPPLIYYDVPEWSVMLANSWRRLMSQPWATLYPALAFLVAILGFTFAGEGLRILTERLTLSFRSILNRYSLSAALVVVLGATWVFGNTSLYVQYSEYANHYQAQRAYEDVAFLAGPEMGGRLSGTPHADRTAGWIAERFRELGLQSANPDGSYLQPIREHYRLLTGLPALTLRGPEGEIVEAVYGVDFALSALGNDVGGHGEGEVVLVVEPAESAWPFPSPGQLYGISAEDAQRTDRVVLSLSVQGQPASGRPWMLGHSALLGLADGPLQDARYELLVQSADTTANVRPAMRLSRALMDRLLASAGESVDTLRRRLADLDPRSGFYLPTGWRAAVDIPQELNDDVAAHHVVAFWPGLDVDMDAEAVVIAAYYDGLGVFPDGTLYPGANDNASGVATLLELVRTLKEQGFQPKRTLFFVAWCGGERQRGVAYERYLRANPYFPDAYRVVAGLELEGVGAGSGDSAVVWRATSNQLTDLLQRAARRVGTPVTTRRQGLHADPNRWPGEDDNVPSATISWAGADDLAHRPGDTWDRLDVQKLERVGRMLALATMVVANDQAY